MSGSVVSLQLAKKYGGKVAFGGFANAILRKLPPEKEGKPRTLPKPKVCNPLFLVVVVLLLFSIECCG